MARGTGEEKYRVSGLVSESALALGCARGTVQACSVGCGRKILAAYMRDDHGLRTDGYAGRRQKCVASVV